MEEKKNRLQGFGMAVPTDSETGKKTVEKSREQAKQALNECDTFIVFGKSEGKSLCASCVSSNPRSIVEYLMMMMEWVKQVKNLRKSTIEGEMDDSIQPLLDEMQKEIANVIENITETKLTKKEIEDKAKEMIDRVKRDTSTLAVCRTIACEAKRSGADKVIEEINKVLPDEMPEADAEVFKGMILSLKNAMPLQMIKAFLNKKSK